MLKKKNRLNKDKEFNNVFKKGRASFNKIVGIKIVSNDLNYNRFGIIVSAKISKKAVERNKVKRKISEVIRLELDKTKEGYDCVIISMPDIMGKKFTEIEKSIKDCFIKLKLYK